MILKGNQRAGAKQLAAHLLRLDENDHVEVHELRGFVADDLTGALREAFAISRATKCRQFLFSLSLSPPELESVSVEAFEKAVSDVEEKLGLTGQPRAIVFHEKQGRRHAHCVWSRIDGEALRAINLPHYKLKLRDVSRQLYIEHGWRMPLGLVNSAERDPFTFSRAEWQQAKRTQQDPKLIKEAFQDCWAISDSLKAFRHALEARGYFLAQGDRRGFVALDVRGEIYAIAKWIGIRTKEVKAKLGTHEGLPTVAETKAHIGGKITDLAKRHLNEAEAAFDERWKPLEARRMKMAQMHREARTTLRSQQETRWITETRLRSRRLSRGLRAVWDFITGRTARISRENEAEGRLALQRDRSERQALVESQLAERQRLQREIRQVRAVHTNEVAKLHRDIAANRSDPAPERESDFDRPSRLRRDKRRDPTL